MTKPIIHKLPPGTTALPMFHVRVPHNVWVDGMGGNRIACKKGTYEAVAAPTPPFEPGDVVVLARSPHIIESADGPGCVVKVLRSSDYVRIDGAS